MHPQPPPEKPWGIGRATGKLNRESQEKRDEKKKEKENQQEVGEKGKVGAKKRDKCTQVSPCHSNKEHHHCPSLVTSQSL
jgi:hypothetical protein